MLILLAALAIRLLGAWHANLVFDERAHWALAETIDLRPGHLHLLSRTLDHPLLSIYILRLGSLLFGTSNFALRLLYILAGTATVLPVYYLACRAFSPRAGLLAAALLAVDLFHAGWSRVFMPEAIMLLLSALAILQFLRTLEKPATGRFVLLGLLMGLAYLAKEPAILLGPAFWICLLIDPGHRPLLRNPRWYLAHAVFAAVIAPDLLWNASQWTDSYLHRDLALAGQTVRISLKPLSLYLGEVFRAVLDRDALGSDYLEGNIYVCHAVAGAIYLAAMAATAAFLVRPARLDRPALSTNRPPAAWWLSFSWSSCSFSCCPAAVSMNRSGGLRSALFRRWSAPAERSIAWRAAGGERADYLVRCCRGDRRPGAGHGRGHVEPRPL